MDLGTTTTTFSTLIGLVCNFKSERRALSDDEHKEFMHWLENKRHKQIKSSIEQNQILNLGLK
ncbi:hypothetical protein, partial [Vibrio parahaemolyticus]